MQLCAFELFNAGHAQALGLETAHTGGDENGFGHKTRALVGLHEKATVFFFTYYRYFFTQVELRSEGMNLF